MSKKVLFIHIPKTAGSSLNRTPIASKVDKKIHPFKTTIMDRIIELGAEDYFKFCFIRNPYSRFYSLYSYFQKMDKNHQFYKYNVRICEVMQKFTSFDEFSEAFLELRMKNNFHFYPQSRYVYCDGIKIADFVGKMENMADDVFKLAETIGVRTNFTIPHANKSTDGMYEKHFSKNSKNIVEKFYAEDLDNFDYSF